MFCGPFRTFDPVRQINQKTLRIEDENQMRNVQGSSLAFSCHNLFAASKNLIRVSSCVGLHANAGKSATKDVLRPPLH